MVWWSTVVWNKMDCWPTFILFLCSSMKISLFATSIRFQARDNFSWDVKLDWLAAERTTWLLRRQNNNNNNARTIVGLCYEKRIFAILTALKSRLMAKLRW